MKRPYETVVIFDGSLPDETVAAEQQKVEDLLKKNADFQRTDVWGKRDLAYEINGKPTGFYCLFIYDGENDVDEKVRKMFRLNQNVLRHMTVVRSDVSSDVPAQGERAEPAETEPTEDHEQGEQAEPAPETAEEGD